MPSIKTIGPGAARPGKVRSDERIPGIAQIGVLLLPLTAGVGASLFSVSLGPIEVYAFKIVVPALFVYAVITVRRDIHLDREILILLGLTAWTALSIFWSVDRPATLQLTLVAVFASMMFASLQFLGDQIPALLVLGWRIALISTGLIGVVELGTGWHLPTEYVSSRPLLTGRVALSVFGNPNDYGAFLCLAIPMALFPLNGRTPRWVWPLAVGSTGLLFMSGSRFALLGLLFACLVVLVRMRHRWWGLPAVWLSVAVGLVSIALLAVVGAQILDKFIALTQPGSLTGTSAGDRLALIANGIWAAVHTGGIGVGGGGFETMLTTWAVPATVREGTVDPHNMWIEILSELGIIGIGSFVLLIVTIWSRVAREWKTGKPGATVLWASLAAYSLAVCTPSSYLKSPVNWMFLGTAYVLSRELAGTGKGSSTSDSTESDPSDVIRRGTIPIPAITPLGSERR